MEICLRTHLMMFFVLLLVGAVFAANEVITPVSIKIYDVNMGIEDNILKVSFLATSNSSSVPNVIYGIQFIDKNSANVKVVFEKSIDDVITLQENLVISRQFSVSIPKYLAGSYEVQLKLENDRGLELIQGVIGTINLAKEEDFVEIITSSCYVTVVGEPYHYRLNEGVDIALNESINANCDVINHFSNDVSVYPVFETRFRDSFGALLDTASLTENVINLKAGESSKILIKIPAQEKPQAYTALLKFKLVGKDNVVSNEVGFHYVIQGVSATIQNVSLDKNYYEKGSNVRVNVFWSGSADSFGGARNSSPPSNVSLLVSVQSNGSNCIESLNENLTGEKELIELSAISVIDCVNPQVTTKILDSSGNVLDSKTFFVYSSAPSVGNFDAQLVIYLGAALIILLCLGLYFIVLKGRKK